MLLQNKNVLKTVSNIAYINDYTIHMISLSENCLKILVDSNVCKDFLTKLHSELIEEKES